MSDLTDTELRALHEALDDEYRAWATYDQVIADFGVVRPFINIREAEARHTQALLAVFTRYELPMPENPGAERPRGMATCGKPAQRAWMPRSPTATCTSGCSRRRSARTLSLCYARCRRPRSNATCPPFGTAPSAAKEPHHELIDTLFDNSARRAARRGALACRPAGRANDRALAQGRAGRASASSARCARRWVGLKPSGGHLQTIGGSSNELMPVGQ